MSVLKKYVVHCWVSGALFPGCLTHMSLMVRVLNVLVVGLCGVLCENCIVDASIKPCACHRHFLCWWWVMVCVISFFFSQFFCQVHLCGHPHVCVCGGLCVRYLGRMVDALAC